VYSELIERLLSVPEEFESDEWSEEVVRRPERLELDEESERSEELFDELFGEASWFELRDEIFDEWSELDERLSRE